MVFFCGAGISKPAGLPGFFELTKRLIAKLGVPSTSKAHMLMRPAIDANDPELAPPLDQVFGILQREYTPEKVERKVAELLKTPRNSNVSNHNTVLLLSRDVNRNPFVVTTNFDLLFERAKRRLTRWSPPMLPSMIGDLMPSGIVYLHGRLQGGQANTSDVPVLVLGSSDFGRAYLADGWATTFIRQLLERRVVVLLGYSASDPPIRYLLEGLSASTSARLRTIYAFDRGEKSEVQAKWRDLGVKAIPFNEFTHLWESLESWAARADDPEAWINHVLSLARQSPRQLLPFERGQVAAFVATTEGSKAFANANPPPTAEWLCVFDKFVRYGKPASDGWGVEAMEIDPHEEYGLDDDPPRPNPADSHAQIEGIDLIASLPEDNGGQAYARLSGISPERMNQSTRRLWALSRWFERVAHQPAAIWWAGRQLHLHPDLLWGLNRRLTGHGDRFDDQVWRIWSLLYEIKEDITRDIHDLGWYDFVALLRRGGWTPAAFRCFEKTIRPRLVVEPPILRAPVPPVENGSIDIDDLLQLGVHSPPRHGSEIEIPDDVLPEVFRVIRRALERAISLLNDAPHQALFFHLPAIEPDERPGHHNHSNGGLESDFLWAVALYKRLCDKFPNQAKLEVSKWPDPDEYFFDKFRIFAWAYQEIFTGAEVASGILSLCQSSFWDGHLQRELLHLLKGRWADFSSGERNAIERRLLSGRDKYPSEGDEEYRDRNTYRVGARLGWMDRSGCQLSKSSLSVLDKVRARSEWKSAWEETADHDMDPRGGFVERRKDAAELITAPLPEITKRAQEGSRRDHGALVEYAPFEGLVRIRPFRALSALAQEGRKGHVQIELWRQLLSDWPNETSDRLVWLCGRRIANLSKENLFELRHYAPDWVQKNLPKLAPKHLEEFWIIWDSIFEKLNASGEEATKSGLGEVRVGGQVVERSRKTISHAINGPIGKLVGALFASLGDRKFQADEGFSKQLTHRLERSLSAVGEGADHAACLIGERLSFLYYVDSNWVKESILPNLKISSPLAEAAWNGLLSRGKVPQSPDLFDLIKGDFLAICEHQTDWLKEDNLEREAAQFLIIATFWTKYDRRYLSNEECRRALQSLSDSGRQAALWMLSNILGKHNAWASFGKQFFSEIWPQEARYQTGATSNSLIQIAENEPDRFPEIVSVVGEYLGPIEHADLFVFRMRRKEKENERATLVQRWPMQVLYVADRIVPREPRYIPHDLAALLTDIAENAPTARTTLSWRRLHELVSK